MVIHGQTIFIGGMVTIPSHGWFIIIIVFPTLTIINHYIYNGY